MKTLRLLLGDQLNKKHSWFKQIDHNVIYLMMEIIPEMTYAKHHIQKMLAFMHAMRKFAKEICHLYGIESNTESITKIASDPRFQSGLYDIISSVDK